MKLHLWGTDFRRSPSEFRSRIYIPEPERPAVLRKLMALGFQDLVYLATCNRVEFYTTANDYFHGTRSQWLRLLEAFGLPESAYYQGYHLEGKSALRHLLRVGASLESLVVGETQVLGQLKQSVRLNQAHGLGIHPTLERAFQVCFQTAKRVRTETGIGTKPVSVASLGLRSLQELEPEFPLENAVVVGRGPISVLIVQWLLKNRPDCPVTWVNRRVDVLATLPESAHTRCLALSEFLRAPGAFTHLFTSTASPEPLFGSAFFSSLGPGRRLCLDFAQPADIDPSARTLTGGKVLQMEDFVREAAQNSLSRAASVQAAESIIDSALREYCLEAKQSPLLREFSAGEPRVLEELAEAILLIERELPEAIQPKVKNWAEKLVKRHWHRSREHLREVLEKLTDPEEQVPLV